MRIANNIMALNAHRQLMINQGGASKSIEKLSSGLRINRAGDDAAGLAISEKMRGQIRGLNMAAKNAQDAISLIQTAEGALNETHAILQRMRELAVQAASDTNTDSDRLELQKEVDQLAIELTRIANNTEFNTQTLLNGAIQDGALGELGFHIGANKGQFITLSIAAMDAQALGVARNVATAELTSATKVDDVEIGASYGDAVVDGATITVEFKSEQNATAAAKEAGAAATLNVDYSVLAGDLKLNGVDVALNEVKALDGSGAGSPIDIDDLVSALQTDIDNVFDGTAHGGVTFKVTESGGVLTITSSETGSGSVVDLTGSGAIAGAGGLGFTDLGPVNGADWSITFTFKSDDPNIGDQDVTVTNKNATEIAGTGDFAGITLITDETPLDNTLQAEFVLTVEESRSARFENGQLVEEAEALGGIDISSRKAANEAIDIIQQAIDKVSAERSKLGAFQNRLEHTIANLGTSAENLQAAESRIRDVDMAQEMMNFTKYQILQQASTAMLAQANLAPQSVLQLLG